MMKVLTRAGAIAASAAIMMMSPGAALANCNGCFGGCIDAYGDDNSESGYRLLSQCFNSCTDEQGFPCMGTVG